MVSYKKQFIFMIICILICIALIFSIFIQVRASAIREMNNRQMIYAKLAAKGIESVLDHHIGTLQVLAQNQHIILMDSEGKDLLRTENKITDPDIKGITRLNARGEIIYTFPSVPGVIGKNISGQDHVQEILRTKKLVVSDVFEAVQGFKSVAIHVPVYRAKTFDGTIAFLVSFNDLSKDYLDNLYIPNDRYAQLINARGKIIHCVTPDHVGRSMLEFYKDNPAATTMINKMMKGEEGEATFIDELGQDVANDVAQKYAVYTPVRAGNGYWSVAVISSERLMLPSVQSIKYQIIILALILTAFFALAVYVAARIRGASVEAQKRQRIEAELIKSAEEIHDLYHNAPCGYHSLDAKGDIVRINDMELSWLGYTREELIGQSYSLLLSEANYDRFAMAFARLREQGLVRDVEYEMIRKDGTTLPVLVTASSVTDAQGNFVMSRSMVLDMTLRREQERRLQESETLYRTALETTSDGITITDIEEGKYVYVNQKLMTTLGRPGEDIIGGPADRYVHPEDVGLGKKYFLERKTSGKNFSYYESRVIKPDGSVALLSVSALDIIFRGRKAVVSFCRDITEQKQKEQDLRESEELYRTALESTSDGVTILQDGKYVYVNQKFLDTLGVTRDDIINRPLGVLAGPEAREGLKEFLDRHPQETSVPDTHITRVPKADGSFIYLQSSSVDTIYQGKPAIISFITNITERKKAEDALRESEELYRTALEKTNDGISIIQDGVYVYANQKLLQTIGREKDGIIGLPLGIYTHPDDRETVKAYYEARRRGAGAPLSYDLRILKPDGLTVYANIKAVGIVYKGKPATIAFFLDITDRKNAEEALRQSEERYRSIIENIDDDYFETDLKGNITFINRPCGWSGRSREELIGMNPSQYTMPEMAKKVSDAFNKIYREGKPARIVDYEVQRKDGSVGHLEMSVSLIRDAEGKPTGFRGISRDVSDRITMEEERKKLTEQLHQAQKMEAIGTLAGGIAHDFNNLLMGIQGYTSLMLLEVDATHPYYEQLRSVQTLVQSGASLTRQLLGFARAGRYEVVPTDLNDLISKSITLFGRTRKEIRIFEKYAEKIWTVEADRGQIEQVLLNMFVNAWQAMPGGGSLYLETENLVLDNTLAKIYDLRPGRYVKTSITDTGVGMDEKTRQRIFDPFFTTKEMGRGTGLGLASAYGIIKGHSGTITVYSEKGQGTTFNVYLPASSKEVHSEELSESEPAGGRETILLVDDEEVITDVTGRLLTGLGYKIVTAGSGDQAIEIYTQKQADIDLVIVDMIMPGMSGSDTFDQLKTINPSVRVILSSGYSLNGKAQAIMERGVRVFLQKPYRLHDLAQKIRTALAD